MAKDKPAPKSPDTKTDKSIESKKQSKPNSQVGSVSPSDTKKQVITHKKSKTVMMALTYLAVVVVIAALAFIYSYSQQDHSIYGKLTHESYNKNGDVFSFEYPRVLEYDGDVVSSISQVQVAYGINQGSNQVLLDVYSLKSSDFYQELHLTPPQLLSQVKNGSGNYVTLLNNARSGLFQLLYTDCSSYLVTSSGQKDVLCVSSGGGYTRARLVGSDKSYQYILQIYTTNSLWNSHQKIWHKVEQSFSYS